MTGVRIPLSLDMPNAPLKILFLISSVGLFVSSSIVITITNSVHAVIGLVSSFFFASCFLLLLECEFFAFLFLTIYVGAIAILFLFVVMMINTKFVRVSKRNPFKYLVFGTLTGSNFVFFVFNLIDVFFPDVAVHGNIPHSFSSGETNYFVEDNVQEIAVLGQVLYTHFVLQFLIAGLILFLSIVGVVALTSNHSKKKLSKDVKQVSRRTNLNYSEEQTVPPTTLNFKNDN